MARLAQVIVCIVLVGFSLISQTLSGKVSNETQLSLNKGRHHHRIAGGSFATEGMFPSFAQLTGNGSYCGAVLVNSRQLLTAAHCIDKYDKSVRFSGIHRFAENAIDLPVARVCKHPKSCHDIAVLTLGQDVELKDDIKPAILCENCKPKWRDLSPIVTGFGMTSNKPNSLPDILKYLKTKWSFSLFRLKSEQYLKTKPGSVCAGDSGSPVYAQINNRQVLVGIVSTGPLFCSATSSTRGAIVDLYNKKKEVMELLNSCKAQSQ